MSPQPPFIQAEQLSAFLYEVSTSLYTDFSVMPKLTSNYCQSFPIGIQNLRFTEVVTEHKMGCGRVGEMIKGVHRTKVSISMHLSCQDLSLIWGSKGLGSS